MQLPFATARLREARASVRYSLRENYPGAVNLYRSAQTLTQEAQTKKRQPKRDEEQDLAARERREMGQGSEAGGGGANSGLSKAERRALRKIAIRGRHGATAREIMPMNETIGLAIAASLVRLKLVVVNNVNRFVLARYKTRSGPSLLLRMTTGVPGALNIHTAHHCHGCVRHQSPSRSTSPA
jgi:hypothetical protein